MGAASRSHQQRDFSKAALDQRKTEVDECIRPANKSHINSQGRVEKDICMAAPREEIKIRTVRDPGCPTPEEKERHNATHSPYRSWCPVCVEAKGKEDPHHKDKGEKRDEGVNVVGMDYKTFGQEDDDDKLTMLVIRDRETMMTFSHPCIVKGASDEWIVKEAQEDLALLGYPRIILKTDGEPAIVQVQG